MHEHCITRQAEGVFADHAPGLGSTSRFSPSGLTRPPAPPRRPSGRGRPGSASEGRRLLREYLGAVREHDGEGDRLMGEMLNDPAWRTPAWGCGGRDLRRLAEARASAVRAILRRQDHSTDRLDRATRALRTFVMAAHAPAPRGPVSVIIGRTLVVVDGRECLSVVEVGDVVTPA